MADLSLRYLLFGSDVTASKVFHEVGENAKKASEKIDGATEHTSGKMGKLAKIAGGALLGIAGAAVGVGVASLEMADTFESAQTRLEGAIINSGGKFDELKGHIDATNKTLEGFGFTNADTESALATLTSATHDPAKAMSQMALAADIARGRNIDLATATGILTKVNTGHVALLGKLGISTKDATGKTISQTEALKRLSQMYGGDAKRSAETFGGKQAELRAKLADTGAQIGMKLVPILLTFVNFVLDKVIPGVQRLWTDVQPYIKNLVDYVQNTLWPLMQRVWEKIQPDVQKLVQLFQSSLAAIIAVIKTDIAIGEYIWRHFGSNILSFVQRSVAGIELVIRGLFTVLSGIFDVISGVLTGKWGKAWGGIEKIVSGAWSVIRGIVESGYAAISAIFTVPFRIASNIWDGIKNGFKDAINWVIGKWDWLMDHLKLHHTFGGYSLGPFGSLPSQTVDIDLGGGARIPTLARGGIVKARPGGILANIGEGRYDEAVIPLNGGSLGGNTYNITVNGMLSTKRDLIAAVEEAAADSLRSGTWRPSGRGLVTAGG